jgi:hypothetical protein
MLVTFLDCLWIISEILDLRFRFRLRVGSGAVGDLANTGFHAPCAWSTKGWPTVAKARSPSSINSEHQDWRQIPPVSLAGGFLMRDVMFGVVSSVREETHSYGFRGASLMRRRTSPRGLRGSISRTMIPKFVAAIMSRQQHRPCQGAKPKCLTRSSGAQSGQAL